MTPILFMLYIYSHIQVGNVIVDDPLEYPVLGSMTSSHAISADPDSERRGAAAATGDSPWAQGIPSPVRRAGGPNIQATFPPGSYLR